MLDESISKATNTAILQQVGQPPPSIVLAAMVEMLSGIPDEVAVDVQWGGSETVWQVYAISGAVFTHLLASKGSADWHGGSMKQHDDPAPKVAVTARRIADITHLTAAGVKANHPVQGFAQVRQAKWTVHFAGAAVQLDDSGRYGDQVAKVALMLRRRFLGIESAAGSSRTA